jgi:hypothetical protein
MGNQSLATAAETGQERFERLLSGEPFKGLRAILDKLSRSREAVWAGVCAGSSFEDVLARLGYRVTLTKQIHIQDCYSRLGPTGGIKAVLPYYDVPTQGAMPTLVNLDSTVTATPKAAAFFNQMLAELQKQLNAH